MTEHPDVPDTATAGLPGPVPVDTVMVGGLFLEKKPFIVLDEGDLQKVVDLTEPFTIVGLGSFPDGTMSSVSIDLEPDEIVYIETDGEPLAAVVEAIINDAEDGPLLQLRWAKPDPDEDDDSASDDDIPLIASVSNLDGVIIARLDAIDENRNTYTFAAPRQVESADVNMLFVAGMRFALVDPLTGEVVYLVALSNEDAEGIFDAVELTNPQDDLTDLLLEEAEASRVGGTISDDD